MAFPRFLKFFLIILCQPCNRQKGILSSWTSRNNPKPILTCAKEVRLWWQHWARGLWRGVVEPGAKPQGYTGKRGRPVEQQSIKDTRWTTSFVCSSHAPALFSERPTRGPSSKASIIVVIISKQQPSGPKQIWGRLIHDVYAWLSTSTRVAVLLDNIHLFIDVISCVYQRRICLTQSPFCHFFLWDQRLQPVAGLKDGAGWAGPILALRWWRTTLSHHTPSPVHGHRGEEALRGHTGQCLRPRSHTDTDLALLLSGWWCQCVLPVLPMVVVHKREVPSNHRWPFWTGIHFVKITRLSLKQRYTQKRYSLKYSSGKKPFWHDFTEFQKCHVNIFVKSENESCLIDHDIYFDHDYSWLTLVNLQRPCKYKYK